MAVRKVFVSLPMRGIDIEDIKVRQNILFAAFAAGMNPNFEYKLIDTLHEDLEAPANNELWYLGESIKALGEADCVIFAQDWRKARGCRVEHLICELYKIPYVYEATEAYYDDEQ